MTEPISLKDVPGVGSAMASKLLQAGITSIEALAVSPLGRFSKVKYGSRFPQGSHLHRKPKFLSTMRFMPKIWNPRRDAPFYT
jgi:hypothetical protein